MARGTTIEDAIPMSRALALAERGRGRTSPNPMVGALIVDDEGVVVGRGAHEFAGGPHAEIHALWDAGSRARGATLYCTLEPCCHRGRTGPCAPELVAAGIRRAVVAMEDPNPVVCGGGIAHLRANGIDVTLGVLRDAALRLNRPFVSVMRRQRPFVTMKAALSLDAKVAAAPGARTVITGAIANRFVHRERAEVDAIAVGSGTVLTDDPLLTARGSFRYRPLIRVVFDRRLRMPTNARMLSTLDGGPVIIVTAADEAARSAGHAKALEDAGARVEPIERGSSFLPAAMAALATAGVTSMIVEGGPRFHRALWDAGLVDRVQLYVAGKSIGAGGVPWLPCTVVSVTDLADLSVRPLGNDVLIEGYVHRPD